MKIYGELSTQDKILLADRRRHTYIYKSDVREVIPKAIVLKTDVSSRDGGEYDTCYIIGTDGQCYATISRAVFEHLESVIDLFAEEPGAVISKIVFKHETSAKGRDYLVAEVEIS